MNKNKALAIALSAGLVLGGASVAHAESDSWDGYGDSYQDAWENASREQDQKIKLDKAKETARQELRDAGVESQMLYDMINNAKTPEGVEAAKAEILESHEDSALDRAKEAARQKLRDAGITGQIFYDMINNAKTPEGVEAAKAEILKSHENSKKEAELKKAKDEAIEELKEAGITSELLLDQIRKAKTIEGVKALKKEILESHEDSKPEEETPIEEENNDDEKSQKPDWMKGLYTEDQLEEALATARGNLLLDGLQDLYDVKAVFAGTNENGEKLYAISRVPKLIEEEKPEEDTKPEDKKKQTLDEWQIEQNEKDGYFTEEDARRAGELALEKAGLEGLYKVEVIKNAVGDMWFWRFVPVEAAEEEKPSIPWTPLTPAEEIKPGTPWTPIVPGETDKPGQDEDDKVVVPEEDEKDKDSKDKDSKDKDSKDKEKEDSKDKEKSKEKSKPAKTKGNNPKTGLAGLAPIYSTLAISMAGIVAARKKND